MKNNEYYSYLEVGVGKDEQGQIDFFYHWLLLFLKSGSSFLYLRVVIDLCFEKQDNPNLAVGGFSFIDDVERLVEAECPGVVSCVGIIMLVSRDALVVTIIKTNDSLREVTKTHQV
ncbi:hypothetical protein KY285_001454 [Solanum tuberosum]|nr:hypothetical protein KY289_004215 [Solanum tuberosum]KAH0765583.1 hypothetical protein KY285_001454 [Solanum tuberosum]